MNMVVKSRCGVEDIRVLRCYSCDTRYWGYWCAFGTTLCPVCGTERVYIGTTAGTSLPSIQARIKALGPDVQKVFEMLLDRLEMGHKQYGVFNAGTDKRDFKKEGNEELIDFLFYEMAARLKTGE